MCHRYLGFPQTKRCLSSLSYNNIIKDDKFEQLLETVTPLSKLPYSEQLKKKQTWCKTFLNAYKEKLHNKRQINLRHIIPSPSTEAYRNKDEFGVRVGVDGNPKTVGFFIGSHKEGNVICVPPTNLVNLRKKHIEIAQMYQDFLRKSPLAVCQDLHDGGYWRNIIVRSNREGDVMAGVIAHPDGASESSVKDSKNELIEYFIKSGLLVNLQYQMCPHTRCSDEEKYPLEILFGEPYIYEQLDDYSFRISLNSFFQVNTEAASILYKKIIEFARPSQKSTLLDLCCGTGVLSILANKYVRGCIGIDISHDGIKDAEFNASSNYINNCHFIAGRVEKKLLPALEQLNVSSEIIAVLNPGRAGVGRSVIKTLRRCMQLSRVIFVSCKADNANTMQNFEDLSSKNFDSSPVFHLTDVQPLDMFPHTNHCELILLFQR